MAAATSALGTAGLGPTGGFETSSCRSSGSGASSGGSVIGKTWVRVDDTNVVLLAKSDGSRQTESGKSYGSLETTSAPEIATGMVAGSRVVLPGG